MRIVFSGGGTGGHIFPAIAVAEAVLKKVPEAEILFIGAKGKMEMEKVPKAGFAIKGLWISGFQRKLTYDNLLVPVKVLHSLLSAFKILKKFKPDVVAGFGGYASGAAVITAAKMGLPTLIQEQNSYPGITNRILKSSADRICIAYENAAEYFPSSKLVMTGNPVRKSLANPVDKDKSLEHFGLNRDKKTVLITGGSLGARSLNEAMKWSFDQLRDEERIQIIWQCGSLYHEDYKVCNTANLENVKIMAFIDNMEMAYSAADLVVSRAGALTVSELSMAGKAAILVPSPNVAEDHQTKNAQALVERDAAVYLADKEVVKKLTTEMIRVIKDQELMERLQQNIRSMSSLDAAERIADELLALVEQKAG